VLTRRWLEEFGGLLGLRERLKLHDGTLHAGAAAGGGFRLTARFPAAS